MLEKTGGTESLYNFGVHNYVHESITRFVHMGCLDVKNKIVQVPSRKHMPTLFTNERYVIYLVLRGDIPEYFEFIINDERHRVSRREIEVSSMKDAEAFRREFAHSVDREFRLELYEEYDKRVRSHTDLAGMRETCRLGIGDVEKAIASDDVFWEKYKNQVHFAMRHRLLTPDTALVLGDRLEDRDDWVQRDIEPIIEQYINNCSGEQKDQHFATAAFLHGCDFADGIQTDSVSSRTAQIDFSEGPDGDDTVCGKALLGEREACGLLPRFLRVFDANTSKSPNTLASELADLLAAHGVDRLLVAGILSGVQEKMAGSTERSLRHEMMCTLVERLLGTGNRMNASLVTYARAAAAV
eukprot:jgi/Antlo1/1033/1923